MAYFELSYGQSVYFTQKGIMLDPVVKQLHIHGSKASSYTVLQEVNVPRLNLRKVAMLF